MFSQNKFRSITISLLVFSILSVGMCFILLGLSKSDKSNDNSSTENSDVDQGQSDGNTSISEWQEIASIELPAANSANYEGKFKNAVQGVEDINEIGPIDSSRTYSLIGDGYINISTEDGYVDTSYEKGAKDFGFGVCWAVTALGYVQDEANTLFETGYGVPLFEFVKRTGHSTKYETYKLVNNGYGWAIYQSKYGIQDYSFKVSQQALELLDNLEVKVVLTSSTDSANSIYGESIGAKVFVRFNQ